MTKYFIPLGLLVTLTLTSGEHYHDSSDDFIEEINSVQSTWKAGKNFDEDTPLSSILNKLGALSDPDGMLGRDDNILPENVTIPDSFDARANWTECANIIGHISDQSNCNSGWAVAVASAISDRLCIHSKGNVSKIISAANILSCCDRCGFKCFGGWTIEAWRYWQTQGVVTGGDFGTKVGCQSYPFPTCEHYGTDNTTYCRGEAPDPACSQACDAGTSMNYTDELYFGLSNYSVYGNVSQLQLEIMTNGPVVAIFLVFADFVNYKSGVYNRTTDLVYDSHAVKLFGWGTENDTDYWLAANSWNANWGDSGFFKILRGVDHCGIESEVTAGLPKL